MKKFWIILLVTLFICGCEIQKEQTIEGVVVNYQSDIVNIKADKTTYEFNYISDLQLKENDIIKITYKGNLNSKILIQKVKIVNIEKIGEHKEDTPPIVTYPESWEDNGIFSIYYDQAYEKLKTMDLKDKINQMFLVRVPKDNQVEIIKNNQFGGIVLFARDFKDLTEQQVIDKINSYQNVSKIPLLTATDEEGGTVVRISSNKLLRNQPFPSPQESYNIGGMRLIKEDALNKADFLNHLGINLLLAPVADVSTNSKDYIYKRTFGKSANETANYIKEVVEILKENNMSMTLKHFPGYGNNLDTHTGIAIDNRSLDSFEKNDFLPFKAGIDAKAESILVSHNIITNIDPKMPASLSIKIHEILRNELGFTGVIMTDELDMDAITKYTKDVDPVVQAIIAGNDLLTITDYEQSYNSVVKALNDGIIKEEQINKAVFKILAWKYDKGLLK